MSNPVGKRKTNPKDNLRILLVDDDEHSAVELGRLIENVWFPGSSVDLVTSETGAQERVRSAAGGSSSFDLVVLDRQLRFDTDGMCHPEHLPERDAGIRLVTEIRLSLPDVPVILWSVIEGDDSVKDDPRVDYVANINDRGHLYSSMRSFLAAGGHTLPAIPKALDGSKRNPEAWILRAGSLVGAVAAIIGAGLVGVRFFHSVFFETKEDHTYNFVANPPMAAAQYAFPDENSRSPAALLEPGSHLEVICRLDTPTKSEKSWVLLDRGTWLRGSQVLPAATEPITLATLPPCELP